MKASILLLLFTLLHADEFHPIDEMEEFECRAEYGISCAEAEEEYATTDDEEYLDELVDIQVLSEEEYENSF